MAIRTTVYVPTDLKRRMDKAKRTNPELNWSELACRAFDQKLGEIAARKKEKDVTDVVQRLRASAFRARTEEAAEGHEDGYAWARDVAEARQLQCLADAREQAGREWRQCFGLDGASPSDCAAEIFVGMIDHEKADQHRVSSFWEEALGDDVRKAHDDEYVISFAEGALQLWDEVADQI